MNSIEEMDMKIQKIISGMLECNILSAELSGYQKLSGGTVSEIYLLDVVGEFYVLKLNEPEVTQPEVLFLNSYKEVKLLPKLLFMDPSSNFIVYSFISGSTNAEGADKKKVLRILVKELINKYKNVAVDSGWGWVDSPTTSWQDFLMDEIHNASKEIGSRMDERDHQLVIEIAKKVGTDIQACLLHGDCGFHNFIFNEENLVGVIDPAPVIGDPVYDLIYAFCSSPADLTKETFDYVTGYLKIGKEKERIVLYENMLIGLYLRIGLSSKHHPADLPQYTKAWSHWLKITGRRGKS